MSEHVHAKPVDDAMRLKPATFRRPRAFRAILYGGLAAGVLDALDATIFNVLRGVSAMRVWQYVASGALGRASFGGGLKTAAFGLSLHFLIASILAGIYYGASLYLPILLRWALMWGLVYGVAVYFVMNYVVTPLSAAPPLTFALAPFINGVAGHALLVGLPIALVTRRERCGNYFEREAGNRVGK
jgi:hypothetical protein